MSSGQGQNAAQMRDIYVVQNPLWQGSQWGGGPSARSPSGAASGPTPAPRLLESIQDTAAMDRHLTPDAGDEHDISKGSSSQGTTTSIVLRQVG
jgi:hypothetical protein